MNKSITSTAIIIGVIVVGLGTFWAVSYFIGAPGPTPSDVTTNPPGTQSNVVMTPGRVALTSWDGGVVQAKDIKADPETKKDSYNTGHYFVAYPPPGSAFDPSAITQPPFAVEYIDSTQYFSIVLLQKPLKETREKAEQYLLTHLGLTRGELCRLQYSVTVPNSVDQTLAGTSLGFSFCNGAVNLP